MTILFIILAVVWLLSFALAAWGVRRLRHLRDIPLFQGAPTPVSIIVAARNEADTIEAALRSVLALDYDDYEVIVVNDRSTDDTRQILERMHHPRLEVVNVETLPSGWLGKNHALHQGAQRARGQYLLFTDADVVMEPAALSRAVAYAENGRFDHIAAFPDLPAPNYWTGACFALFGMGFLMLTQPWFARNGKTPLPVGVGAFNLIRRSSYDAVRGHTTIPLRPDDDIAIAYRLRSNGARQDILTGHGLIRVEWYKSLRAMIHGLEKNSFAPFEYSFPLLMIPMLLHVVAYVVPWLGLFFTGTIRAAALVAIVGQIMTMGASGAVSLPTWRYTPVMPLAAIVFEYTVIRAAVLTLVRGGIRWRDTFYSLPQLRSNRLRT